MPAYPDLVTQAFLAAQLADAGLTANQTAQLPFLGACASRLVREWCNRAFTRQTYDELYSADPRLPLVLRQDPVNNVWRVATDPTAVLTVTNAGGAVQRATAALQTAGNADYGLSAVGLSLFSVASGVATTDTSVAFANNPTAASVAAAVNALGGGWSASADATFGLWPSADFRAVQGAAPCLSPARAEFKIHVRDLPFEVDERDGVVGLTTSGADDPFTSVTFGPNFETSWGDQTLSPGFNNLRVVYDAGYDTIPEPVQQACVMAAQSALARLATDPALLSERDGNYSYQADPNLMALPRAAVQLLAPFRRPRA